MLPVVRVALETNELASLVVRDNVRSCSDAGCAGTGLRFDRDLIEDASYFDQPLRQVDDDRARIGRVYVDFAGAEKLLSDRSGNF